MGGRTLRNEALFDIDLPHYAAEVALKRELLGASPHEYFSGGAELLGAQWGVLELVLTDLSEHYPERFELERFGHHWRWHNLLLGEERAFSGATRRACRSSPSTGPVGRSKKTWCSSAPTRTPPLSGGSSVFQTVGPSATESDARL